MIEAPCPTLPADTRHHARPASDQILISGAPINSHLTSEHLSPTDVQSLDGRTFAEILQRRLRAEVEADQWVRGLLVQCGQELRSHGVGLIINQVELAGRAEIEQAVLQGHCAPLDLKTVSVSLKLRAKRLETTTWTLHAFEEGQEPWISSGRQEQLREALLSHYYARLLNMLERQLKASLE